MKPAALLVGLSVLGSAPAIARADDEPRRAKNCLGDPLPKLDLEQALLGATNPLSLEHRLRLGYCTPLVKRPDLIYFLTHLELGGLAYLSPSQGHLGVFARLVPLSFLVLRAEAAGFAVWPIPLSGTGYIPLSGYKPFDADTISPATGGSTVLGVRTWLSAAFQAELPLGRKLSLIVYDIFLGEWYRLSKDGYYYNIRVDSILSGRGDWAVSNTALLLLSIKLAERYSLRVGATDDWGWIPSTGDSYNLASGLVGLFIAEPGNRVKSINVFARVGGYTEHAFRTGVSMAAGIVIQYELWKSAPAPTAAPLPAP